MSVLDFSKTLMYDFYYNKLLKHYGKNADLLYTDTDSLLLEIKTENVYKDMERNFEEYDTSDSQKIISFITQKIKKSLVK